MTPDELRLVKQLLAPWVERVEISQATMKEIASLTETKKTIAESYVQSRKLPDILTRAEATQYLGISKMTIIRWERLGKIKSIKIAGEKLVRYKLADVEALLFTIDED